MSRTGGGTVLAENYGKVYAMTSSDGGLPKKPPPLAPMTTYCLPSRPM